MLGLRLETTIEGASDDEFELLGPSQRLGPYVLLHRLGAGGMGVVHAAHDERLDRKVAIKLLHARKSEHHQARLVREAQALARVSHPNVVQIYEIGEAQRHTFIVMEFVEGETLSVWRARVRPKWREILAVFEAAGRGLLAAHEAGLVHRDFKPDNVMVRRDGRVLVMDFGLARGQTDASEPGELGESDRRGLASSASSLTEPLTEAGALIGTPNYMAPEQLASREADAKSDQFAFCVALWEALYGQRPFVARTIEQLTEQVHHARPAAPEGSDVPGWLRERIERGLAPAPSDRWPTMAELLDELARDPTRRRRAWWFGGVSLVLLAAAFAATSLDRSRREAAIQTRCEAAGQALVAGHWRASDQAAYEQAFLASGANEAAAHWAHARAAIDDPIARWSTLRETTCLAAGEAATDTATEACLDEQRAMLVALLDAWRSPDRNAVARAAVAAATLPPVERCVDARWLAHRVEPPRELDTRARVAALRERLEQAKVAILLADHGGGLALATAVESEAMRLGWPPLVAEARAQIGAARAGLGEYEQARASMQDAFFMAGAAGHDMLALHTATSLVFVLGYQLAEHDEGLIWGRLGTMLVERMRVEDSLEAARLLNAVAVVREDRGEFALALVDYRRALAIQERVLGPDHLHVAVTINNIGSAQMNLGDLDAALVSLRRALAIRSAQLGPTHADVAASLDNVAALRQRQGANAEALASFEAALPIWEATLGPNHPEVALSLHNIGMVRHHLGQLDEALVAHRRALAIRETKLGVEHPDYADSLWAIALVRAAQGARAEALAGHREALAILTRTFGPEHPRVREVAEDLHALAAAGPAIDDGEPAPR